MIGGTFISTDRQARDAEQALSELEHALSSDHILKSIVEGLPQEVISGVRRSLLIERKEREQHLLAYRQARTGDFALLRKQAGNDPGSYLITARIIRGLSQKELARKLGLREQAIQRWETERYRSISLLNYQKVAQTLGVRWQMSDVRSSDTQWPPAYDVGRNDLNKVVRHARSHGWLNPSDTSDENAISTLVRYVGDHVSRYGTPSLLRTGLNVIDHAQDWSLLSWKAQVTRRAEAIVAQAKPRYRAINVSWLVDLIKLSPLEDGPLQARDLLLENGIVLVVEPQISGMSVDGGG